MGYAGGTTKDPTYYHLGNHTETVQVDYDPSKITFRQLLNIFWEGHDPSAQSWSRQYAAIIFYHDEEQKRLAEETKSEVAAETGRPVRTEIVPFREFYLAEDYHQKHALRLNRAFLEEMSTYYPDARSLTDSTAAARLNGYLGGEGTYENLQVELDDLGLSPAGKEALRALVGRHRTRAGCPVQP